MPRACLLLRNLCVLDPCYYTSAGWQDWGTAHGSAPLLTPARVLCDRGGVTGVTSEPKFQFLPFLCFWFWCFFPFFFFFPAVLGSGSLPASCSGPACAVILERKLKNIPKKCCLSLVRSSLTFSNLMLSSSVSLQDCAELSLSGPTPQILLNLRAFIHKYVLEKSDSLLCVTSCG